MYGYFVDLRTCGGYFTDRRPQLGPQNTHWLVRRSAGPQVRKIPEATNVRSQNGIIAIIASGPMLSGTKWMYTLGQSDMLLQYFIDRKFTSRNQDLACFLPFLTSLMVHLHLHQGVQGLFAPRYFRSSERKFPLGGSCCCASWL